MAAPAGAAAQRPGPRPDVEPPVQYARVLPEACVVVPDVVDHLRREGAPDTALYTPERDRLSPEGRAELARCLDALGRTSPHPWQWPALARAELALGNDAVAKAWHDKYLAHLASVSLPRRAWAHVLVASAYADASPPRLAAAEAVLRALEEMGQPAARARLLAHQRLMEAAIRHGDDSLRVREAEACFRAYRELSPSLREVLTFEGTACVVGKAEVMLRRQGRVPALAILDTGLVVVKGRGVGVLQRDRGHYTLVGTSAAPLEATRWFHRADPGPKPARGVVTLLHYVRHSGGSERQYQALRRLATRFASRPFELIAHAKTMGFFGDSGAGASMPPEREMVLDSAFFYGYARMPGTLAVVATRFTIAPDGRRVEQATPQETNYRRAGLVLVDKRGIVRYAASSVPSSYGEEIFTRMIEALLAEP